MAVRTVATVGLTAMVTAVLTSLFWIAAYGVTVERAAPSGVRQEAPLPPI